MQKTITCANCKKEVPANPCLKGNQEYCNDPACQNARKKEWYKKRIQSDPDYASRQKECKQRWRKNKPAHAYQKCYRETHPEYVRRNRKQQKERNRRRRMQERENKSKIVNIDALYALQDKTMTYQMKIITPNMFAKIVKIDSLLVQIQPYQDISPHSE
jgi:FtsZ-interacting cell division protein YlmF